MARALGLPPPPRRAGLATPLAFALALGLLGLAAAQPALSRHASLTVRRDAEVIFVLDTSRSMAAAGGPGARSRLARASAAALALRAAVPGVAAGVATLTDRVLPDLLPVPDPLAFSAVVEQLVRVNSPPPAAPSIRATNYRALASLAAGNFFAVGATRRVVVLESDGESSPFSPARLARALDPAHGYRLLALRFGQPGERVYLANGHPDPGYRPDPAAAMLMRSLAGVAEARVLDEHELAAAQGALRALVGSGESRATSLSAPRRIPLAPWLAASAVASLLFGALAVAGLPVRPAAIPPRAWPLRRRQPRAVEARWTRPPAAGRKEPR